MKIEGDGQLLRIFVGVSDTWRDRPLFEAILSRVREEGVVGATVVRGIEGFGATTRLQANDAKRESENPPVVIEIIDAQDRIAKILPVLDEMVSEGMVTVERVHIIAYRTTKKR